MQKAKEKTSWFYRRFLNNKVTIFILNIVLIFLAIFLLIQIRGIFNPVRQFVLAIFIPVLISGLLFYLFNPLIDFLEKKFHIKRVITIAGLFILIFLFLIFLTFYVFPIIINQVVTLATSIPHYYQVLISWLTDKFDTHTVKGISDNFYNYVVNYFKSSSTQIAHFVQGLLKNVTGIVGKLATAVVNIVTVPFLLFFMLKDGRKLKTSIGNLIPVRYRQSGVKLLEDINQQVAFYVRGQLIVAFCVAIIFIIGYWIIGLKYGLLLGILAGVFNVIPFFGSWLSEIPTIIVALFISPMMVVKVLLVFVIEWLLESQLISPLVMSANMKMHPVTTLLVLLTAGNLFGLFGVIFGIPIYAVIKIIVGRVFNWYKMRTGAYEENLIVEEEKID
ncbi:AI-2E family transporter [Xylocopilactobacillus apicola]|uniref:AI-2E family transporter n=1 Tax=Xylocopilactobacillus apicola TaxID=2932184 RepID=A0AAU9DS64_9LACO|nr:AI-2E family transporter [Xylocopilactobacillus apicola]BDR58834.1 AI-2E family transporter [Xylocopilactobacillus apicola]